MSRELGNLDTMEGLRDWALRRVRLDVGAFLATDMPAMSVHLPKGRDARVEPVAHVRVQGGAILGLMRLKRLSVVQQATIETNGQITVVLRNRDSQRAMEAES